jgi:hypothetical protein
MISCTTSPDFNYGPEDYIIYDMADEPDTGPYMTLATFFSGVMAGAYGPDEDCRWVSISEAGTLVETPIKQPNEVRPRRTIAVAYYAA